MLEWLESLGSNEIVLSIFAFLSANLGIILTQVIVGIKNKVKLVNKDELYRKAELEIKEFYDKKFNDYQETIVKYLESLEAKITANQEELEKAKEKAVEAKQLKLTESVQAAKEQLSINDILEVE